jgi:hypothetical protein
MSRIYWMFYNLVESYIKIKRDYVKRDSSSGFLTIFSKKKDSNFNAIYNLFVDSVFDLKTCDTEEMKVTKTYEKDYASYNPAMRNFWTEPHLYYLLKTLNHIFASKDFSRKKFYSNLVKKSTKTVSSNANVLQSPNTLRFSDSPGMDPINHSIGPGQNAVLRATGKYFNEKQQGDIITRHLNEHERNTNEIFLSLMTKLNTDLLGFLNSNINLNKYWWHMLKVYKLVNSIFKNLCEGNNINFKKF